MNEWLLLFYKLSFNILNKTSQNVPNLTLSSYKFDSCKSRLIISNCREILSPPILIYKIWYLS